MSFHGVWVFWVNAKMEETMDKRAKMAETRRDSLNQRLVLVVLGSRGWLTAAEPPLLPVVELEKSF